MCQYGFERMNLRKLAKESGIQAGSLYNYFSSKDEFLYKVICDIMSDLLEDIDENLKGVNKPAERLQVYVRTMVWWHCERRKEAYISHREFRSLPESGYEEVRLLRKRFEMILGEIIHDGIETGDFEVAYPDVTVIAILNTLTSISTWYRPGGPKSVEQLADAYEDLIGHMLQINN